MDKITINIPKQLENDINSFRFFHKLFSEIKELHNKDIYFDFKKNRWLEANLTAILGSIFSHLIENNNKVSFGGMSNSVRNVLLKNGFLNSFGLVDSLNDIYESTIKYNKFLSKDRVSFQIYLKDEFIPKINLIMTNEFKKEFRLNLEEVFQNSRIHGKCENIYVCGQYYYHHKKVKFTIVDLGVSIPEHVRGKLEVDINDDDAINWATKDGNSTKIDTSGGIGLYQLREFLKENGGKIQISSGSGYWEECENIINKTNFEHIFKGTIVNIEVDINNKVYISTNEKNDLNSVVTNIF